MTDDVSQDGAGLAVTTLGAFACRVAGESVARWGAGRSRGLVQFLVSQRGRSAAREELVEALWPESEPDNAANSLKVAVHALRRVLRPAPGVQVEFTGCGYALHGDVWADVDDLAALSRSARAAERDGDQRIAAECSAGATELHAGDFLPGEDAEWARDRRTWARLEILGVHDAARRVALSAGDPVAVHAAALASLEVDPCHEPAYQAMIWLHARRGERSAVDAWFRRCRRRLRADLDLHPNSLTTALHSRAMSGDRDRDLPVELLAS